ncbi:NnrS family protein [Halomonas salinarum]|uniref:NnrS family protein n=1 Tax=Halomonas salinarum TaxID=1158993 RepID=UPI001ADE202A|nr:NnrS family protein [Halomonas salinarum]
MAGEVSQPRLSALSRVMPLWRLAFRPFFLLGALFSLLAMGVWGAFWHGSLLLAPQGGMVWWHQHEMLFGFVAAIVAGFLLTAVQNWTGQRSLHGWSLLAVVLVWLAGRLVIAFPGLMSPFGGPSGLPVALVDLAFLPLVAGAMARRVIRVKQWRNLIFVPVLALLVTANALMHWGLAQGDAALVRTGAHLAVLLITLLMVVLGGRVIPFFTSRHLNRPKAEPCARLEWLAIGGVASLVLIGLSRAVGIEAPAILTAVLAIVAGVANLVRLARWEGWRTRHEPLLWGLHASYAFVGLGLVMFGLSALEVLSLSLAIHALTVGGMATMILSMLSRVSLGHTGRTIKALPGIGVALGMMLLAAALRALVPTLWPQITHWTLSLSILLWCLAYTVFVLHYAWPLLSARPDGKEG